MKPLERNNTMVSSVNNTTSFKMQTSADTFEIFSSQIYEHKIRAIIRELSCNAYDAHVDAGKRDVPFRIHFPTIFEPFFEVEDYGIGLDDYDIRGQEKILYDEDGNEVQRYMEGGIYTTYFASTKRESNESIGHLGLGSKSPLAYTKSMTVIARKAGVERHYVCFISEDGQPQTTFNSEKPTDKGNGVLVRFSVAQNDFEEFTREAKFVLSLFRVKPETNVTVETHLTDDELNQMYDKGSLILDRSHSFVSHEPAMVYANMGGVVYPVRSLDYYYMGNEVLVNEDDYNTGVDDEPIYHTFDSATVKFIRSMIERSDKRIVVNYPIGSLSFMPSREGLSQDQQTKLNFYKHLVDLFYEQVKQLQDKITASSCKLEAIMNFAEFSDPNDTYAFEYSYDGDTIAHLMYRNAFKALVDLVSDTDKVICHYRDYRGQYRYSQSEYDTVMRRKSVFNMTFQDLYQSIEVQSQYDCFYVSDKEELKGMAKAIRFFVKSHDIGHKFFFIYDDEVDKTFYHEFNKVMMGKVRFRPISELVDEVKAIEPTFFEKKKRGAGGKAKVRASKKNETKAVILSSYRGGQNKAQKPMFNHTRSKVLVDLTRFNHKTTMVVDKTSSDCQLPYSVTACGSYKNFNDSTLREYMEFFGVNTCILADGINRNRISKSGIPTLTQLITDHVNKNKDRYYEEFKYHSGLSSRLIAVSIDGDGLTDEKVIDTYIRGIGYNHIHTFKYLYENDTDFTKPACDQAIARLRSLASNIPGECFNQNRRMFGVFFDVPESVYLEGSNIRQVEDDIKDEFYKITKAVKSRYPLVFGVDNDEGVVLEYVNLINSKHNQNIKQVA